MRFQELPLRPAVLAALEAMGFEEATPVQADAIPLLLAGRDVLAQAQTGTGKTAAYGIPLVEARCSGRRGLVLCPTRELAQQVQRELQAIGKGSPVDVVCLIGGAPFHEQVRALRHHPDAILVATPGRIVDHLSRGTLDLGGMSILVLDEADEMLSMGFQDDLDAIVAALPRPRQTMLFSATLSPAIERLARAALADAVTVRAGARGPTADSVRQSFALVRPDDRAEAVRRILAVEQPQAAILFCRTRERVETLAAELGTLSPEALHGGMGQPARDAAMQRLRSGRTRLLVATDVAARGLDVEGIEMVIHDEPAADVDTYIHRTGRTGRAGRTGRSILLVPPHAARRLNHVQSIAGRFERYTIPDGAAVADAQAAQAVERLRAAEPTPAARAVVEAALRQGLAPEEVAARALQLLLGATDAKALGAPEPEAAGTIAVCLKVGAVDGLRPGDVIGAFVNEGGLQASDVGRIDILPHVTMAEVPEAQATRLVGALHRAQFRSRRLLPRLAEDWKFKQGR